VDWLPWGNEAFARARAGDRPILLDIGAVWCHWCHVMDRESYEDANTAALINELFVPVKVDRDEKPDVDARYQRAVQLLTGQGGWPLTAFLTPDGEVFYGGTYFPPDDRYGRPSFARVLREVARVWREERDRALQAASQIGERLTTAAAAEARPGEPDAALVSATIEELAQSFDFRYGGFGQAPKFPNAGGIDLVLDEYLDTGVDWTRRIAEETLLAMARGGFYDQIGGGFHRYSTDARWIIPHFEKMAYDNGVLLATTARAYAVLEDAELRAAAAAVIDWHRDVAGPLRAEGGFIASQDADFSPDDDGDYWTWTTAELRTALQDEELFRAALTCYGLDDHASAMHLDPQRHVLYRALSTEALARRLGISVDDAAARIATIRTRLKEVRDARPQPYVDRTLYSGWNGLVASGFLAAARHLDRDDAAEDALKALERVWRESFRDGAGLLHRAGDDASGYHLDDHAHVLLALLDAFEYTQDTAWLERARALADIMLRRFATATGALRDRPSDERGVVAALDRAYLPIADAPSPSGNGAGALALLRLHALVGDDRWLTAGTAIVRAFAGSANKLGSGAATYMKAVSWLTRPVTTVVIVDDEGSELFARALRSPRPRTVVRRFTPGAVDVSALPAEIAAMVTAAAPRAYVCAGRTCAAPVSDAAALASLLRDFTG
jgi:uncharacterized protein YyaL (SSP411 family)